MKSNIKWTESCLECQAEHGGICESEDCAKLNYDPWATNIRCGYSAQTMMDGKNILHKSEKELNQKMKTCNQMRYFT